MNSGFFKFLASPLTRACLCLAACLLLLTPAHAKRTALVIGNDNYTTVSKLQKAGNDATAMARELRAAGFAVQLHKDLNYRSMVKAVETFANGITGGDEVVVFYAGHGVQIKTGSYLLPTDIEAMSESEVEKTAYELNALSDKISEAKPAFTLVLVDACRDNPLKSRGRSVGNARGLSAIEPPKGQIVVYSASRGQQALDRLGAKDANPNGVFTREFIARMKKPGVKIEDLMREVQDSVEALAKTVNHEQRPAIYNEARGNFYFFGPTTVQVVPTVPVAPEMTASQREDAFWSDAKAAGNRDAFQAYLDSYPQGRYATLARANVARQSSASATPLPSPAVNKVPPQAAAQTKPNPSQVFELTKSAQNGNVQAMGELCEVLLRKNRDPAAALGWCQKGAMNHNTTAMLGMAVLSFSGAGVTKDVPRAIEYAEQVAVSTDPVLSLEAEKFLGDLYQEGKDVPQDIGKALKWLMSAANKGDGGSQHEVISIFAKGTGVPQDLAKAEGMAASWAASAPEKMVDLADIYGDGEYGIPQDKTKAKIWLDRAAAAGSPEIIMKVADRFLRGKVVKEDKISAHFLYSRLAELGNAEAQDSLGDMYSSKGVMHDVKKAAYWYQKAATQGFASAQESLGRAYMEGEGVPKNSARGADWLNRAASQGEHSAQTQLGLYYEDKDLVLAYAWYNLAAADEHQSLAHVGRNMLLKRMSKQQVEEAERLSGNWKMGETLKRNQRAQK